MHMSALSLCDVFTTGVKILDFNTAKRLFKVSLGDNG
jgi:hypothetical protein